MRRVARATQRIADKQSGGAPRKRAEPRLSRLDRDIVLVAPRGCHASVLVTLIKRDDRHRYYAWLAMVGRGVGDVTVSYRHAATDTIRLDLPDGVPLSAKSLEPHLAQFLASTSELDGPPPVIIED
jgi:hypothetical protein